MSEITAFAPSNIALIKYWGRDDEELKWPSNDSLSMTLSKARTVSQARIVEEKDHLLLLNGERKDRFQDKKVFTFLDLLKTQLAPAMPSHQNFEIVTKNSFPTGCGLASSASGFAALTLAVVAAVMGEQRARQMFADEKGRARLAHLARLGSGSATRSLYGGFVEWQRGESPDAQVVVPLYEKAHWPLYDTVVLFSKTQKEVSSSKAHKLAPTSPLFAPRLGGLKERQQRMRQALAARDLDLLGREMEEECLEMHAVMMTSTPPVHYFGHEVASFLRWLRELRAQKGVRAYFTMDAGPNVHILSEACDLDRLHRALQVRLPDVSLFVDQVGSGPGYEVGGLEG